MYLQEKGGLYRTTQDVIDKMQNYGINTADIYRNIVDCNNGEIGDANVGNGDGYQKCFFDLRTFGGTFKSPCDSEGWKKSPELRLNDDICHPPKLKGPVPCRSKVFNSISRLIWTGGRGRNVRYLEIAMYLSVTRCSCEQSGRRGQ